ncbi:MAG: hypothetical protein CME07_01810 [Gemmatimonadetes bacterium]|nr:hypothetical protein [Gemmatimonadota bacterium]
MRNPSGYREGHAPRHRETDGCSVVRSSVVDPVAQRGQRAVRQGVLKERHSRGPGSLQHLNEHAGRRTERNHTNAPGGGILVHQLVVGVAGEKQIASGGGPRVATVAGAVKLQNRLNIQRKRRVRDLLAPAGTREAVPFAPCPEQDRAQQNRRTLPSHRPPPRSPRILPHPARSRVLFTRPPRRKTACLGSGRPRNLRCRLREAGECAGKPGADSVRVTTGRCPIARRKGAGDLFRYSHVGVQFALIVLAFTYGGVRLDERVDGHGVIALLAIFAGAAIGFYVLYRETRGGSLRDPEDPDTGGDGSRGRRSHPDGPDRRP